MTRRIRLFHQTERRLLRRQTLLRPILIEWNHLSLKLAHLANRNLRLKDKHRARRGRFFCLPEGRPPATTNDQQGESMPEQQYDCQHDHENIDGHSHGHEHGGQGHSHAPASFGRAFAIGTAINLGFVIVEVIYGLQPVRSHFLPTPVII